MEIILLHKIGTTDPEPIYKSESNSSPYMPPTYPHKKKTWLKNLKKAHSIDNYRKSIGTNKVKNHRSKNFHDLRFQFQRAFEEDLYRFIKNNPLHPVVLQITGKRKGSIKEHFPVKKPKNQDMRVDPSITRDSRTGDEVIEAPIQHLAGEYGTVLSHWKPKRKSGKTKAKIAKTKKFNARVRNIIQRTVSPKFNYINGSDANSITIANGKAQKWYYLEFAHLTDYSLIKERLDAIKEVRGEAVAKYETYGMYLDSIRYHINLYMINAEITTYVPMELTVYHCTCKKNINVEDYANMDAILNANPLGDLSTVATVDGTALTVYTDNSYLTPYNHQVFLEYWTIGRSERYMMTQGKSIQLNGTYFPGSSLHRKTRNRVIGGDTSGRVASDFIQDIWAYAGKTKMMLFAIRSLDGATSDGTKGQMKVSLHKFYKFHGDTFKQNNFTAILD